MLTTHQRKPTFKPINKTKSSESDEIDDLVKFIQSKSMKVVKRGKKKQQMDDEYECDDADVISEIKQQLASLMTPTQSAAGTTVDSEATKPPMGSCVAFSTGTECHLSER